MINVPLCWFRYTTTTSASRMQLPDCIRLLTQGLALFSQITLITFIVEPPKFIVNRQIGVGDSKYVIVFDPLLTGHVIRRMRSDRVRIFYGNQWETL